MNSIVVSLLAALLIPGTGHALPDSSVAKKVDSPRDSVIKPQPMPVSCPKEDSLRRSETKKDPPAKNAMPPKGGQNDCLDNVPVPDRPMAWLGPDAPFASHRAWAPKASGEISGGIAGGRKKSGRGRPARHRADRPNSRSRRMRSEGSGQRVRA